MLDRFCTRYPRLALALVEALRRTVEAQQAR